MINLTMSNICPHNSKKIQETGKGFHFDALTILTYLSTIEQFAWIIQLIGPPRIVYESELETDHFLSIHINKATNEIKVNCDIERQFLLKYELLVIEKIKFGFQREEIIRAIKLRFAPPLRKAVLYSYK